MNGIFLNPITYRSINFRYPRKWFTHYIHETSVALYFLYLVSSGTSQESTGSTLVRLRKSLDTKRLSGKKKRWGGGGCYGMTGDNRLSKAARWVADCTRMTNLSYQHPWTC